MMMDTRISKKTFKVYFVRGLMVGLLGSLCMGSFLALRGTDRIDADMSRVHMRGAEQPDYRKKVVAFVGVQTGFSKHFNNPKYIYELRRAALRNTWFPNSQAKLDRLEKDYGIVVKFVMGHSKDDTKEWDVTVEEKRHGGFLRLDLEEDYLQLADKTLLFFKTVVKHYNAEYIFKIDDDVFFRLDRVPYVVRQWALQKSDYVGCMKRGQVFTDARERWNEPQHSVIGNNYYTHSWGTAYALSGRAAHLLEVIPNGTLRFFNNEDTSMGAWMLGLNVTHFDDRRMCSAHCTESSIVVYDYPKCAGLCDPQGELAQLNLMVDCKGPAVPEGQQDVPMEKELIPLTGVTSRNSNLPQ